MKKSNLSSHMHWLVPMHCMKAPHITMQDLPALVMPSVMPVVMVLVHRSRSKISPSDDEDTKKKTKRQKETRHTISYPRQQETI